MSSSSSSSLSLAKKPKLKMTTNPNWLDLPTDITSNILQRIGTFDIVKNARYVCSYWWNICKDPSMWRHIQMGNFHIYHQYSFLKKLCFQYFPNYYHDTHIDYLAMLCEYAINLSSGHLEKIDIYGFGSDDLLKYIADRASNLRSIELDSCIRVSDEGLCEVAKKFPMLEEISISHDFESMKSLEVIGLSCPLLKSLKLNGSTGDDIMCDDEALNIAKTMSGLRHLHICGNPLSDVGLTAILDGCPLLESLHIAECYNLEFSESLRKRLHNQIKDLKIVECCSDSSGSDSGSSETFTDDEFNSEEEDFDD